MWWWQFVIFKMTLAIVKILLKRSVFADFCVIRWSKRLQITNIHAYDWWNKKLHIFIPILVNGKNIERFLNIKLIILINTLINRLWVCYFPKTAKNWFLSIEISSIIHVKPIQKPTTYGQRSTWMDEVLMWCVSQFTRVRYK